MNALSPQSDRSRLPANRADAPSRAKKVSETLDKIDETYLAPFRAFERLGAKPYTVGDDARPIMDRDPHCAGWRYPENDRSEA